MLYITYIGKQNQTNAFIAESLENLFDARVEFAKPEISLKNPADIKSNDPDLVVVDLDTSYGLGNAPRNIQHLNEEITPTPILVLLPYENTKLTERIKESGAKGIVSSTPAESVLAQAIKKLRAGKTFYPQDH